MACIQINKDYRISSDAYCWRVEKYAGISKKKGIQIWNVKSYHATYNQAADSLAQRLLRSSDAQTIDELKKEAHNVRITLENANNGQMY